MAYATIDDLQSWLGQDAPDPASVAAAERMLDRASEIIEDNTRTAIYTVDDDNNAVDADVIAAFRDATCAQVEFWFAGDEEDDILGPVDSLSLGGMTAKFSQGNDRLTPMFLAPRAARILRNADIYRGPPVIV